ncbi:MAG: TIGR03620 family F420-dependent LLM class oxidoreductase [Acidimicrobiia bacterium]|nr:TIGR03620 family F420-dependent LLM class oxidoreductase [Acidimicrobiia bacterium]
MTIDIGRVGIWTGALDGHPSSVAREAALELESLGYSTLWVPEAVGREPFVFSAVLLGATSRLKLATGIANIYARDPMTTVGAQKTLAEAFPGRFLLGLGVSHQHLVQNLRKHDYSRPLSYMKTYLAAMDEAMFAAVSPAEDPGRVIAALGPKMLEVAATQAGGAHPYFTTPEHTATARQVMGAGPLLAPEQMVVLDTDPGRAREVARAGMTVYLRAPNYLNNLRRLGFSDEDWADYKNPSDRLVDAIVAWGDVDAIAARVKAHHDAGADHVCVQVLRGDRELPRQEWRELAPALVAR